MIVISNAVSKSGSTLMVTYQEELLKAANIRSGQSALRASIGGRFLGRSEHTTGNLLKLTKIHMLKGTLVLKCHWPPTLKMRLFCRIFRIRMTMTYRDPRDIVLSMIDHGRKSRSGESPTRTRAFSQFHNIDDALPRVQSRMDEFLTWRKLPYVHAIRYEELMSDPFNKLKDMIAFLGWSIEDQVLQELIDHQEKNKQSSMNFNKGTTERWRTEMSQEEQDKCLEAFEPYLRELSYELY